MVALWENWQGSSPLVYAQNTIKACGLKEPPFCENTIADFLDLTIYDISSEDFLAFKQNFPQHNQIDRIVKDASTFLVRKPNGEKIIFTPENVSSGRRRTNIFHEFGHDIIPWHDQYCYICGDVDLDPTVHKQLEQEAFHCGSEFLMPRSYFVDDLIGLGIGISSIQLLSKRYLASLEATAVHYAKTHPGICAVLMIEPVNQQEPLISFHRHFNPEQKLLPVGRPYASIVRREPDGNPLRVKYAVRSRRFVDYIPFGQSIADDNLLYKCWETKTTQVGEIKATCFGFIDKPDYRVECIPLGYQNRVLALLWESDEQMAFAFNWAAS